MKDRYVDSVILRDRKLPPRRSRDRWYRCTCGRWWGKNKRFACDCGVLPPSIDPVAWNLSHRRFCEAFGIRFEPREGARR